MCSARQPTNDAGRIFRLRRCCGGPLAVVNVARRRGVVNIHPPVRVPWRGVRCSGYIVLQVAMLAACQPVSDAGQRPAAPSTAASASPTSPDCKSTDVRVVDEDGRPLAGVEVWATRTEVIRGSMPETSRQTHEEGPVSRTGPDGWASVCNPAPGQTQPFAGANRFVARKKGWPGAYATARKPIVLGPPRDVWLDIQTRCSADGYELSVGSFGSLDKPIVQARQATQVRLSGVGPFEYQATVRCCGSTVQATFNGRNVDGPVPIVATERTIFEPELARRSFEITTAGTRPRSVATGRFDDRGEAKVSLPEAPGRCLRLATDAGCEVGRLTHYSGKSPSQVSVLDAPQVLAACGTCSTPVAPDPLPRSTARPRSLSVGGASSCAVLTDGTLECWGSNTMDMLGDGSGLDQPTPVPVPGLTEVQEVTLGSEHACARLLDGSVWCWGNGAHGTLGNGSLHGHSPVPRRVPGLDATSVVAAGHHTCAVSRAGTAWCWGHNDYGQLGVGDREDRGEPTRVLGLRNVVAMDTEGFHSCALLRGGEVQCWGSNSHGQIGAGRVGGDVYRTRPVRLAGHPRFDELSLRHHATCGRRGEALWCWGQGYGRTPTRHPGGTHVRAVVSNSWVCILDDQGGVSCNTASKDTFTPVEGMTNVVELDVGIGHVCALHSDGETTCRGQNKHGQLGIGTCGRASW